MPFIIRATAAAIFFAIMFLVKGAAHAVADMGLLVWLLVIGAIFWAGITLENRIRIGQGRAPYSWTESRELMGPLSAFAAIMAIAYLIR